MTIGSVHSLRTRLMALLMGLALLAAIGQGFSVYRTALSEADVIFDYHMRQMALALRPGRALAGANWIGGPFDPDDNFDFVIQVWGADGSQVFGYTPGLALPRRAVLGFSSVQADGGTYRVFSMQTSTGVIQIAQDMAVRRQIAGNLAARAAAPILLLLPLLMLMVWWVVSGSLAPVASVRSQLARRHADDLSPVDEKGLPEEVLPLARELNLLFDRVRDAFDAQKNFVADAAHELRSPLAALTLQAAALQRAGSDEAKAVAIARLTAGIERASRLIEQLLVLARQEASLATGAKAEPVSLAGISRLAVADAAAEARARGIDLGMRGEGDHVIAGHPEALRVLVRNLIENAIKYTPSGGTVDLSVHADAENFALCIEDSGPGIPPEDRERVLDRFYRASGTQAPGSGLGLAIVRSVANLHRAKLLLDRSGRLGGLRVRVVFARESG